MAKANVANTLVVPAASKISPYYDDFDESKNFHRIMFRPGYAVQARELTQLQTILQNQIERFGRHIFVNGSSVIGGKLDITDVITLNVVPQYANIDVNISNFENRTITYSSGNNDVVARVVATSPATNVSPACLHVKYITGNEFGPGATIQASNTQIFANLVSTSNVSSNGAVAFIYDSIYFMQGHFIKVPSHAIAISKHHRNANVKVGLELTDEIITELDDTSLLDPAQEASNYQAPGAGRYRLDLNLATRELDSIDDEKWIQVAIIKKGVIRELQSSPIYSEIEEVLARRTYDESGNYIVKPFSIRVSDSSTDFANNLTMTIDAGKAYVYGFEVENFSPTQIELPKARSTASRTNYDVRVNYGNYVIVNNVAGTFHTAGQGLIDLHCVTAANVSIASNTAYHSTKIGTARIRDLNFYSGDTNVNNRKFELYFYDNKFRTITDNASATSSNTSLITLSSDSSTANDAYTGAFIKIIAGNAASDLRLITAYNGVSKVATVASPFSANTNSSSRYELRFDITDVDSFYQSSVYTPNAASNAYSTIDLLNKDDGTYNGNTFIFEPAVTEAYYQLPGAYIASTSNTAYIYRRVYNTVSFTSGNATITSATNEQFEGETSTSNISSSVMDNFLVIVTNPAGSSRSVGDQVRITTTVNNTTPETAVLRTGNTTESFTATVYSKMKVIGSSPRVKTLVTANTLYYPASSPSSVVVRPSGNTTNVHLSTGHVIIDNPSRVEKNSLYISDVVAVPKIYWTDTLPSAGSAIGNLQDVTNRFVVERGHRPEFYDHASITLKSGFTLNPGGFLIVCTRFFNHTTDTGYYSVDSYPDLNNLITEDGRFQLGTGYSQIPVVNDIRMSDVVDFRPARPNGASSEEYNFNSARIPIATSSFTTDFSFYLERKDIIVLNENEKLKLIQGDADGRNFPATPSRSLLLHKLRLLPYTATASDVSIQSLDYKRYTMADIGKLDRRLKNVEYYVQLNTLEKSADSLTIKDVNGLDRAKYGILAEDFSSHILGDVLNPDYACSVDVTGTFSPTGGVLMPRVESQYIDLEANTATGVGVSVFDDKVTLAFTTTAAITQTTATKSISVTEFLFGKFRGQITTLPEFDMWKDTTVIPEEVISLPQPTTNVVIEDPYVPPQEATYDKLLLMYDIPIANDPLQIGRLLWIKTGDLIYSEPNMSLYTPDQLWADGYWHWSLGPGWTDADLPRNIGGSFGTTPEQFRDALVPYPGPGPLLVGGRQQTIGMTNRQLYSLVKSSLSYNEPGIVGIFNPFYHSLFPYKYGNIGLSDEWIEYIYDLYDAILNRPPDFPGLVYWCITSKIFRWSAYQLRDAMTQAASFNFELSSSFDPNTTIEVTPYKILSTDTDTKTFAASLVEPGKIFKPTEQFGDYETTLPTPEGRRFLVARTESSLIEAYYETYLGRTYDLEGRDYWVKRFKELEATNLAATPSKGQNIFDKELARRQTVATILDGFGRSTERTNYNYFNPFTNTHNQ